MTFPSGAKQQQTTTTATKAYIQCPDNKIAADFIAKTNGRRFTAPDPAQLAKAKATESSSNEDAEAAVVISNVAAPNQAKKTQPVQCECRLAPFPVIVVSSQDKKYEDTIQ